MSSSKITPFVKWAGGKRQLLPQIKARMPEKYNNYYEPFVGGGAVVFGLQPTNTWINDINKALINAYKQICNVPEEFLKTVNKLDAEMWEDGKAYYYLMREHYNDKLMKEEYDVELAALFVFINKHCFNGLYRVNGKGLFNVPYNNSRRVSVDEMVIRDISEYLQGVTIMDGDFEKACVDAKKGDFVFIDSPYAPLNPTSFESYTKEGFDIESHKRVAKFYDELTARGCYCMITNHNTELINELYGNKGYKIDVLTLQRLKHVGFLCTFTSKYTRKHIRLISFHKTFTTKDTFVSINDSIRLVSKPKNYLAKFYIATRFVLLQPSISLFNGS